MERWLFPFLSSATKENVVVACVSQSMMVATTLDLKTGVVTVNGTVVWLSGMRTRASSMTSGDQHGFEYSQSRVRKTATVALVAVSRVCGGASTESVTRHWQMKEKGKNEQTVMLWSVNEKEPLLPYVKVAKDAPPTRGSSVSVLWNGVKGVFARALKERKGRRTCRSWWLKRGLPRTGQRTGHCPTSLLRVCTLCLLRRQSRTHTQRTQLL